MIIIIIVMIIIIIVMIIMINIMITLRDHLIFHRRRRGCPSYLKNWVLVHFDGKGLFSKTTVDFSHLVPVWELWRSLRKTNPRWPPCVSSNYSMKFITIRVVEPVRSNEVLIFLSPKIFSTIFSPVWVQIGGLFHQLPAHMRRKNTNLKMSNIIRQKLPKILIWRCSTLSEKN